jgi:hypothetical protein
MEFMTKTSSEDYNKEFRENFAKNLGKIMENTIIPNFGSSLSFNIELGNFTSEEYGSYRIPFYNKEGSLVCYIIADVIFGEWRIFKSE